MADKKKGPSGQEYPGKGRNLGSAVAAFDLNSTPQRGPWHSRWSGCLAGWRRRLDLLGLLASQFARFPVTFVWFSLRSLRMMCAETGSSASSRLQATFYTTHWSVVLAAAQSDGPRAQAALAKLCEAYWYPLYAYVRRRGYSAPDAQDLNQEFFAKLLEGSSLASATPELGRFRSYLLTAMKHFLASEWKQRRAQKRGGGAPVLSLDWAAAEQRFDLEPATHASPDKLFEQQWAVTVLASALKRLEQEYQSQCKGPLFERLKHTLSGARESQPYAKLGLRMGMSEAAVKVIVHRLRRHYRGLIRDEIANTLNDPREVDSEMRYLFTVLTGG